MKQEQYMIFITNIDHVDVLSLAQDFMKHIPMLKNPKIQPTLDIKLPNYLLIDFDMVKITTECVYVMGNDIVGDGIHDVLRKVFEVLSVNQIFVNRFGYVLDEINNEFNNIKFRQKLFNEDGIVKSKQFNVAWFQEIAYEDNTYNYWQKYIVDERNNLIYAIDINTLVDYKLKNANELEIFIKAINNIKKRENALSEVL